MALGDVDGDGDLDLVAGNFDGTNRLYLNNGTADPFNGVTGTNISGDAQQTYSIALGDVDGDGDLDLVAGNMSQANRLYLNNGTADPFSGVTGTNISGDAHATCSIALGDVDGDGDLDLVAGNWGQTNRLYLNNGTADPFNGVTGIDISSDAHYTYVHCAGGRGRRRRPGPGGREYYGQTNRLYLNNGTADPFNGVSGTNISAMYAYILAGAGGRGRGRRPGPGGGEYLSSQPPVPEQRHGRSLQRGDRYRYHHRCARYHVHRAGGRGRRRRPRPGGGELWIKPTACT